MKVRLLLLILIFPLLCIAQQPEIRREFRGVWVTTLANLDWPSATGLSAQAQQREFISLLDRLKAAGINAVLVQVRSAGDAFYPSKLVPWSHNISGKQGQPPHPYYDPLKFMIDAAHERHIEFHAWFNPFRAQTSTRWQKLHPSNIINQHPEWTFWYDDIRYFNPGIPEARQHIIDVIAEVVRNYDLDGVHLDDYFYPYPVDECSIEDISTYSSFKGDCYNLHQWRRENVNAFIRDLSDSIHSIKPFVKFGVSPFAIWRSKDQDPNGLKVSGMLSSYDEIYADSRKWVKEKWVDYIVPQIYWGTGRKHGNFTEILNWWAEETGGPHVMAGIGLYKMEELTEEGEPIEWAEPEEFVKQVIICRANEKVCGEVFFRSGLVKKNVRGFTSSLSGRIYTEMALLPLMNWLDSIPPARPQNFNMTDTEGGKFFSWEPGDDKSYYYMLFRREGPRDLEPLVLSELLYFGKFPRYLDQGLKAGKKYTWYLFSLDRHTRFCERPVYRTETYTGTAQP